MQSALLDLPGMPATLPCLSLWQPWASALAIGSKGPETRGWPCPPRLIGKPLAIHAAKRAPRLDEMGEEFAEVCEQVTGYAWSDLPLGCVIGIVRVVKVYRTDDLQSDLLRRWWKCDGKPLGELEYMLGNYAPGRYAWAVEILERFAEPIPAKGMQGIWEWADPRAAGRAA